MAGDAEPSDDHEEQAQQPEEQKLASGGGEDEAEGDDDQEDPGKEEEQEQSTPKSRKRRRRAADKAEAATPATDRPARERKSVDRYSASSSGGTPPKALTIAKGSGTQLKDIPNVAFKFSKMKPDGNLRALHSILFGKKAKAHSLKRNIGQFSGFVWSGDDEKQRAKVKDKLEKCVKEKLVYFCDVLNIPINKATVRKEDLSVKLLEFLESPHPTTDVLLAEKEQGQKRKRKSASSKSLRSGDVSVEGTEKKRKKKGKVGEKKMTSSAAGEDMKGDDNMTQSANGDDSSEDNEKDKVSEEEDPQTESKSEEEEDTKEEKEEEDTKEEEEEIRGNASIKDEAKDGKGSETGVSTKPGRKGNSVKSSQSPSTSRKKSSSSKKNDGKAGDTSGSPASVKRSVSKKKKAEKDKEKDQDASSKEKSASKKQSSKSPVKASQKDQGKGKPKEAAKAGPSREEIHEVVVKILKEVDFNTSTLSDILKQLGTHFDVDFYSRKMEVKEILTDVISNMSDEEGEGDEDEEDAENDDAEDADK